MNHIVLARNNNDKTAERIASFVDRDYLNSINADDHDEWLDNVGLHARWMVWSADTDQEAQKLAEDRRAAPNNFTIVHVVHDSTGQPLTSEVLARIVKSLPTDH